MITDNNGQCRASLAELEQDRELNVNATTEEIVQERVEELMDADSTDDDSIVVLLEDEEFVKRLRLVLSTSKPKCLESPEAVGRLIKTDLMIDRAEMVLSEYVEKSL